VAVVTVELFTERVRRLYEQNATASRIEEYARRRLIWVRSGVQRVELGWVGDEARSPLTTGSCKVTFTLSQCAGCLNFLPNR